jgi:Tol biopolymer transport system component/DNA-binding winged helix-turn-helix (wHTH) protein
MATQPQSRLHLAFGPFEVHTEAGELRKRGIRVRLSGQPFQILLLLLAHPGEVVTREQLRQEVWGAGTFVDFEHGLNAAMNKLRRALNDSPDNPRYIETLAGRGYRFIGNLERPQPTATPRAAEPLVPEQPAGPPRRHLWWWLASIAACVISFAVGRQFHNPPLPPLSWRITRLTADAGLSAFPALSPDGKLVAYSSDHGLPGGQDLYVKQAVGGEPIRLTFDGAGDTSPDFSPDGSKIVFRSNRDGGGIYEIPAFGGEVRLLAREGLDPKFSPDGSQIAYWIGANNVAAAIPGSGAVWVVPAAGGQPQRVGRNLTAARYPIWSPDGKHLLFIGYTSEKAYDTSSIDWWLAATDGSVALRTGAYDALSRAGLDSHDSIRYGVDSIRYGIDIPAPRCWLRATNNVIFPALSGGDTRSLWEIGMSPATGRVSGVFKRLTAGADDEVSPSCAAEDTFAFTNLENRIAIWSLPFDLNRGASQGALERTTVESPAWHEHAALSSNGRFVAFASAQSGRMNIWLRDLATGQESHVANSSFVQRFPVINRAGDKIAFSSYESGKRLVYVSTPGGVPEKLCEGCLRATDWSRDEKALLIFGGNPYQINLLDVASRQQTTLLKHATYNLLYARFSPDNRWVSFTARIQPNRAWIMIAPIDGPRPVPESAWIKIAEEQAEDWANWSPDGKTLYFTSARDGHFCLWGQRIDANSRTPVGQAFAAQHIHGRVSYDKGGWSAAEGRIALVLNESAGNIWLMSHPASKSGPPNAAQ